MSALHVLSVASEAYPLIKTGGLADVVGTLPGALAAEGIATRTLLPFYPSVARAVPNAEAVHAFAELFGGPAWLRAGTAHGLDLLLLDAPHLFDRPGGPYVAPDGTDWPDNPVRFAALARVAASLAKGLLPGYAPDVVHAHDWQAGLTPAYLFYDGGPRPGTVITVHNLAFQGQFPASLLPLLGLPPSSFTMGGVEYYGMIGYLKAGLRFADRITTVSPTYAAEICTPEAGMGLDGLLRGRADVLSGIVNGIDVEVWDPARDRTIPRVFDALHPGGRRDDKAALQERFGLTVDAGAPLFGVISRLSWQKGLDLLLGALPVLLEQGAQLALLGSGEPALEAAFTAAATQHSGRIGCRIGYDETLAHLIQAGSDAIVVPSRFEPCGLTQLCALRYGAIPVVSHVGGLVDTVVDATDEAIAAGTATGVQFAPVTQDGLETAIRRAVTLLRTPRTWRAMQLTGMETDVSWRGPARQYAALYTEIAQRI